MTKEHSAAIKQLSPSDTELLHRELYRAGFEDALALLELPSLEQVSDRVTEIIGDFT